MSSNLIFGLSEAVDGEMKLTERRGAGQVLKNRKKYFASLGIELKNVVWAGVAQGEKIAYANKANAGKTLARTDGLITDKPGVILAITAADCLPIYYYEEKNQVAGLVHAGWRGVARNFPVKMLRVMAKKFKTDPGLVKVWIGPHLKSCHFAVGPELAKKFNKYGGQIIKRNGKIFIDLAGVVEKQLMEAGLRPENFKTFGGCTHCGKNYFSFRRDRPKTIKAMAAFIGRK